MSMAGLVIAKAKVPSGFIAKGRPMRAVLRLMICPLVENASIYLLSDTKVSILV
jgi:hypothetical protein